VGTRLQGVSIPVDLDTRQAERKLDELERKADRTAKAEARGTAPGYGRSPSGRVTGQSNSISGGTTLVSLKEQKDIASGLFDDVTKLQRIERMRKFARIHMQEATKANSITGKIGNAANVIKDAAAPILATGAAYLAASTALKAAPVVATGAAALAGVTPKALLDQLDFVRSRVQYLESFVTSLISGFSKTHEVAEAQAYITGEIPNLGLVYQYQRKSELYEDQLNKRLGNFKSDNLAGAVGRSLHEMMKQGMNK